MEEYFNDDYLLDLTDFQLRVLRLIQRLSYDIKKQSDNKHEEPTITLPYSYIVALLKCSHSSVKKALDRLCEYDILEQISNNFGECATYRYNPTVYKSLIREAKKEMTTLITGRNKQKNEVTASTVLKYVTGKAIVKGRKAK